MLRPSNIKKVSILCVVAFVAGVLHTPYADGVVLCIGDDGHIDVETARDGVCSSSSPENPYSSEEIQHERLLYNEFEREHCGECNDVPICEHEEVSSVITRHAISKDLVLPPVISSGYEMDRVSITQGFSISKPLKLSSFSLTSLRSVSLQR